MTRQRLDLPVDVPWKLIAVSPDMMDTTFGNKAFPFAFRSSLSISAFEPAAEDLPDDACGERISYLKLSASVTGYQPTKEETDRGYTEFPNVPTEDLNRIFREYFACYGVLVNLAVFPRRSVVVEPQPDCDHFADLAVGQQLANPLNRPGNVRYTALGQAANRAVDTYPIGGDGKAELDLGAQMTVQLPACMGVSAHVAQRQPDPQTRRLCVSFATLAPNSDVPNPYTTSGITFLQREQRPIHVVDLNPPAGDGQGELDLTDDFEARFPACDKVEVQVVQGKAAPAPASQDPITVRAFRQGQQVASASSPGDGLQTLTLAAPGIDQLVFKAPRKPSSLVQLCRFVTEVVAPEPVTMDVYAGDDLVGSRTAGAALGRLETLTVKGQNIDRVIFKAPSRNASLIEFCRDVPHERPVQLADYPHVVEFEPKTRDLYQAGTLQGEVLTASRGEVSTDKSMSHTTSTQTGVSVGASYGQGGASVSGSLSHSWGETNQDSFATQAENSRERRERQGTTTNINQMYNLLTGYHLGTNRVSFLMLPRPHMLQPTDHRTFVKGLRMIEGVQDFFLIVRRPEGMDGICIEATLDTGHFPEKVDVVTPPPVYDTGTDDFVVSVHANPGVIGGGECKNIQDQAASVYNLAAGWVVDRTKGDSGHPGIGEIEVNDNQQSRTSLRAYDYRAISDNAVQVFGTICGAAWGGPGAIFDRKYRVFRRSQNPKPGGDPVVTSPFFITTRTLKACFVSGERCPRPVAPAQQALAAGVAAAEAAEPEAEPESIVHEQRMELDPRVFERTEEETVMPATKELLRQIQFLLSTSWRAADRRPPGATGFLATDYFKDRIAEAVGKEQLDAPLEKVGGVPERVVESLGPGTTVAEAIELDLQEFATRTGLDLGEAAEARLGLLRGGE